jgi:lipoyl(octanoyl) transferase
VRFQDLGTQEYSVTLSAMKTFTKNRAPDSLDEIWCVEHPATFTVGLSQNESLLDFQLKKIPVVKSDRGGNITFHGPGQVVMYFLFNIRRANLSVREMVIRLERSVLDLLSDYNVCATGDREKPGVYVNGRKIAALGLKVSRGATYHGMALNVDMDLSPFSMIDPCGYKDLEVTQLRDLGINKSSESVSQDWLKKIMACFNYEELA